MVFNPKFRGEILVGEIRDATERIIRDICAKIGIEILELAVNEDHVHIFYRYPPKYSVSYIANMIKGISSKKLREMFPELKKWCKNGLWAPSCFHASVGQGWEVVEKYISTQRQYRK
jgi:putative transposase